MVAPFSKMPALPVAAGLVAGILLWTASMPWWCTLISFALGIGLMCARLHYLAFAFYATAAGWALAMLHSPQGAPQGVFDGEERAYGAVIRKISSSTTSQTVFLRIDSMETAGRMMPCGPFLISSSMLPDWSLFVGEKIRIKAVLEPNDIYSDFPHDRDSKFYNLRHGIAAQTFLDENDIQHVGTEKSVAWWLAQRRQSLINILAHSGLNETSYQLISAITVGHTDELDGTMRENFRAAGIAHALALSGFHVGIIIVLVSVALFPLRAWYRLRRPRLVIALLLIWFYAAIVGMPDSVVRATVMLSIILIGKILGLKDYPYNSLCAAVAIILAVSPFSLFSAGFLLSVAAVIGILALSDKLNPFDPRNHRAYRLAMLFTVPVSAIAGTMSITAAAFHRLPVFFCLSNVLISILLPPLMFCGIAVIICTALGFKAVLLCKVCDALSWLIDNTADTIAGFKFSEVSGFYLTDIQIAALAVALVLIMVWANFPGKKAVRIYAPTMCLCIACFAIFTEKIPENEAFIVSQSGNTPIVARSGNKAVAVFTCHPRHFENATMKFNRRCADYFSSRAVDSVLVADGDFSLGPYSRQGNILTLGRKRIALLSRPGKLDSLPGKVHYALVCSRFTGTIEDIELYAHPDTIVLSRDISIKKAMRLKNGANTPIIDLRHRR